MVPHAERSSLSISSGSFCHLFVPHPDILKDDPSFVCAVGLNRRTSGLATLGRLVWFASALSSGERRSRCELRDKLSDLLLHANQLLLHIKHHRDNWVRRSGGSYNGNF